MGVLYDKIRDRLKFMSHKSHGAYFDGINSMFGYIPKFRQCKKFYPDPITGKLEIKLSKWTLGVWLDSSDASTITDTGGLVDQWDDKSGNSRHAFPVAPTSKARTGVVTIGGLNTVDADGGGTFMSGAFAPQIQLDTEVHIFQARQIGVSSVERPGEVVFDLNHNATGSADRLTDVGEAFARGVSPNPFQSPHSSPNPQLPLIPLGDRIVYSKYVNATGSLERFVDGDTAVQSSYTFTAPHFPGTANGIDTYYLFCDSTGGDDMVGGMGEFIVILGCLPLTDAQVIEGRLAWKWGLEGNLPISHPHKLVAPPDFPWE